MGFEMMAPLMFAGLVVFLLLGYPMAFSLAANGLLFAIVVGRTRSSRHLDLTQEREDRF